ncbi:MAG: low molecular weight phosphotyrosine protein phosphatase [Silicimonas sp.]|nr:low molecular weight phosphotyrosine protein phosphatase [Silicimonas sp.]NNL35986.1 low molecular weight phosphotyrosine protein phosphatase [Silicimonas sp.]
MTRILCVCLGNICRSPTAEAVLRQMDPMLTVDSAGTGDWHIGSPPYAPAIAAGKARGYDLSTLRARQFSASDFARFDLILAMDSANLDSIEALRPSGSDTPVRLFLDFADGFQGQDIPDPYFTRDFNGALDLVETAASGLLTTLGRN